MALLFIGARHRPEHFEFLSREFSADVEAGELRILFDRGHEPRRRRTLPRTPERRRGDRRGRRELDETLHILGWAIARRRASPRQVAPIGQAIAALASPPPDRRFMTVEQA